MIRVAHSPNPRSPFAAHRLLPVLVAVLLTGVPQLAAVLSDGRVDLEEEALRPVRRALLLDKVIGDPYLLVSPSAWAGDARAVRPEAAGATDVHRTRRVRLGAPPRPQLWLAGVMHVLHLHHSNFT